MNYPKKIFVKDYFEIHDYYEKIYGKNRTIVLIQVGAFHECYGAPGLGLNLENLAQELDVVCTAKNKNLDINKKNPKMLGFPIHVLDNFIEKLMDLNYTVVVIDQITEPPNPKRQVTRIESPATFINKTKSFYTPSYLVSLVFDKMSKNNPILIAGMTAYDISTGKGYFYETYSTKNDINIGLDNTIRFLEMFPPKEIILYFNVKDDEKISNLTPDEITSYLKINKNIIYKLPDFKKYFQSKHQKYVISQYFNFENQLSLFDNLEMNNYHWTRVSFTAIIDYIASHQPNLLTKINPPTLFSNKNNLFLGNRAISQLSVINNDNKSLFNLVNYCKTCIGRRYLREQLTNPIYQPSVLEERYNYISIFSENQMNQHIEQYLDNIYDMDKIIRKMEIKINHPYELYQLYQSINSILKIAVKLEEFNVDFDFDYNILNEISTYLENNFNIDNIDKINFINFLETDISMFKPNVSQPIDETFDKINTCNNFLEELVNTLSKYIDDKNYFYKNSNVINVKYNERDGHYLMITTRRCKILKKALDKNTSGKIKVGNIEMNISNLEFVPQPKSNNTKINCKKLKDISLELSDLKKEFAQLQKTVFYQKIDEIIYKFNNSLKKSSLFISFVDFINSGSLVSIKNGYSKPQIEHTDESFIDAENIRHPIVEYINNDTIYQPHNIKIGKDLKGMLLYGINSSGKSTLMKSIGLNVILAQIGYFVASTKFTFSPFLNLFTRISGNDDIYRGLSSFMIEMVELMSILKRNDKNTLVLGDEICRGTEEKSANIIVAYMLETLEKSNSCFVTATHLHKISELPSVKNLDKVKPFHLKVIYDEINKNIIYQRDLVEGVGENFYGLQVAQYLMDNKQFNYRTEELTKEFDDSSPKSSKYNKNVILDKCYFCKNNNNIECHHINWQKDFNKNKIHYEKIHIKKDKKYNLIAVCSKCHDKIDRNEINVNGFQMTAKGTKLDYSLDSPIINEKKYNNDTVKFIKSLESKCSNTKEAKIMVKENKDIKISKSTIKKIWKNQY